METDTTFVRAILNGRECNLREDLTRRYLVDYFQIEPTATITVRIPREESRRVETESLLDQVLSITPGTVVNAILTENA